MGHKPRVDFNVAGVRAEHQIDVWVEFDYFGVRIRWIIECKAWRTRVTKEKVAALRSIADDVGADRAFLLSETGFQRGAIAAATGTNITLSSLAALREAAEMQLSERFIANVRTRAARLSDALYGLFRHEQVGPSQWKGRPIEGAEDAAARLGVVTVIEMLVRRAADGQFPFMMPASPDGSSFVRISTFRQFAKKTTSLLRETEKWARRVAPSAG